MNARRDSSDEPSPGSFGGRALLVGAGLFAVAATALLVLTDEMRWLRLGIVAALWAALVGAFIAARYRRQLADQREAADDRQKIYELELEREVAARREYELETVAEAKRQAEEEARDDIAELRNELQRMRQTLEGLMGGEFLVERYQLHAESTRMRSLPEERSLAVRNDVKHLPPARNDVVPPVVREAETELIERIREVHQKPRRDPHREVHRQEPKPAEARPARRSERPRPDRPTPEPVKAAYVEHPAEVSDRWFMPDGLTDTPPPPSRRREPAPAPEPDPVPPSRSEAPPRRPVDAPPQRPTEPAPRRAAPAPSWEEGTGEWQPTWEQSGYRTPAPAPVAHDPSIPFGGQAEQTSWLAQYNKPEPEPTYTSRAYVPPSVQETPMPEPTLTDRPSRRTAEYHDELPGRRHSEPEPEQPQETGGGRRRRAEGQPSWQETMGRVDQPTGSHAAGRSVSELLANHGLDSSPRRRRRREE